MKPIKLLIILMIAVITSSCGWLNWWETDPDPNPEQNNITAFTFIEAMETDLAASVLLSASDAGLIGDGARSAVENDTEDVEAVIEKIIEGAVSTIGLGTFDSLSTENRLEVIDLILTSILESVDEYKEDVLSRAIDPYAFAMEQILAQISAAAIRNLSDAGLAPAELAEGAQSTVKSLITALDNGGVQAEEVPSVIQVITRSAVENIAENTGASTGTVILDAAKSITLGAVSAIDDIEVEGFNPEQVPEVVGGITAGATVAVEMIADDVAEDTSTSSTIEAISILTSEISASALEGADTLDMISSDHLIDVVETVTESAIEAVAEISITGISTDTANTTTETIIGQITESVSGAAVNMASFGEGEVQVVLTAVVTGASDGAQTIDAGFDQATLETVIVIDEDGDDSTDAVALTDIEDEGLQTFLQEAVETGIIKADNLPPVADAGENGITEILAELTLDGNGSSDPDTGDSITEYIWFIASQPDDSSEALITQTDVTQSTAVFVPDVAGEYILGLKVTDTRGDSDTNYIKVEVPIPDTALEYDGMTAQARLDAAIILRKDEEDPESALVHLKKILTYYPETAIFSTVYLETGKCLNNLGRYAESQEYYEIVRTVYPDSTDYPDALLQIAWNYQWWFRDTDRFDLTTAAAYFEILQGAEYSGTMYVAEGLHGLGFNYMMAESPDWETARTKFTQALADANISHNNRFWSLFHFAETYAWANDGETAIIEWNKIFDSPANTLNDEGETDYWKIQLAHNSIAWTYIKLDDQASAMDEWQKIIDTPGIPGRYRGDASSSIGNRYKDNGNNAENITEAVGFYEEAETALNNAYNYAIGDDPNSAYWARVSLLWNYKDWIRALVDDEQSTDNVYQKFLTVRTALLDNPAEYAEQKIDAYMAYADLHAWDLADENYDEAIASAEAAFELAVFNNLDQEAWCRRHLGYFYSHLGWENRNRFGINWRAYFYTAIDYVKGITYEKFPDDPWDVAEAQNIVANAYRGLEEYNAAITLIEGILAAPPAYFDGNEEELIELRSNLVSCYIDKGHAFRDRDYYSESLTEFQNAVTAGQSALTSIENDTFEDAGDRADVEDWINSMIGDAYLASGWLYRDELDDEIEAATNFNNAITTLGLVTENLDNWDYYWAKRNIAEAYLGLYNYSGARNAYDDVLDIIDDYDPEERGRILIDKAETYRQEIEDYDWDDPNFETDMTNLYNSGKSAFQDAVNDSGTTQEFLSRAYRRMGNLTSNYAHDLYWGEDYFMELMDEAITAFIAATNVNDDFEDYDNDVSDAYMEMGEAYRAKAHSYADSRGWNTEDGYDPEIYKGYLLESITPFEQALGQDTNPKVNPQNVDIHTIMNAKRELTYTYFDLVDTFNLEEDPLSAYQTYLQDGFNFAFEVLATEEVDEEDAVDLMIKLAEFNGILDGETIVSDAGNYDFSFEKALGFCTIVVENYGHIESGYYGAWAQWGIGRINKALSDEEMENSNYEAAEEHSLDAIEMLSLVPENYPDLDGDDSWLYNEAESDLENAYLGLGYIYEAAGEIQNAIDTFQWVVDNSGEEERITEAQGKIDELNAL